MNNAFEYCKTTRRVTKRELINALHQSYLQLRAIEGANLETNFDNKPALRSAEECMSKAGHIGFTK